MRPYVALVDGEGEGEGGFAVGVGDSEGGFVFAGIAEGAEDVSGSAPPPKSQEYSSGPSPVTSALKVASVPLSPSVGLTEIICGGSPGWVLTTLLG